MSGARKTGGGTANKKNRDKAQASAMKQRGETRTSQRCPLCGSVVSLEGFPGHIRTGCGKGSVTK